MKSSTVYQAYDHDGCGVIVTVLGHAKDLDRNCRAVQLHYEGNLDDCLKRNDRAYCVHSTLFPPELNERLWNNFYFDRSEAIQAAKEAGAEDAGVWCTSYYYILNSGEKYAPLEFPVIAQLHRNKKGLYCRLNVHPEIDGLSASGKFFFPDRSCASTLCEGPVIIESIEDHGTFGFFTGKLEHFSAPSTM